MIYIHGLGHFHPQNIIDNAFLENLDIGTNDDWIMQRVGIAQRRTNLALDYIKTTHNQDPRQAKHHAYHTSGETGAMAAEMALKRAGLAKEDIGLVIAGGCDPEYSLPANASIVAAELGIEVESFDINSACSTFAAHMHALNRMRPEALPDYILLVIPENWTSTIDYSDRSTAVLIGDCSVAMVVSLTQPSPYRVPYTTLHSTPSGWRKVATPAGEHFTQEGSAVQKFAIKKTLAMIEEIQQKNALDPQSHYFIGHQANLLMLEAVCRKSGITPNHHLFNVDQFGNCGAAGAPSVLSMNWQKFKPGDQIVVAVVGSGLTFGGLLIDIGETS